jgi:hypothetical protein
MMDSRGRLEVPGDSYPRWRQVCTLRQKELEVNTLSVSFSDTSDKLQDLSIVLDNNTLLTELELNVKVSEVNMYSVFATTLEKDGVDAVTLAHNRVIGIKETKRMRLVNTQRGVKRMIHTSITKQFKTNDFQLG